VRTKIEDENGRESLVLLERAVNGGHDRRVAGGQRDEPIVLGDTLHDERYWVGREVAGVEVL
jgi:hypothetical protein